LQTERDKARLLDGLEGVAASTGEGFDRAGLDKLISGLDKRVFLLHNVHEKEPLLFQTRWTMSYLRGPLGREELKRLRGASGSDTWTTAAASTAAGSTSAASMASKGAQASPAVATGSAPTPSAGTAHAPVLDPAIQQYFAPGAGSTWVPAIVGAARIAYT